MNASQTVRNIRIGVLSIVLTGTVPTIRAQVNTWTGNGENWNEGAHWSAGVPAASHDVVIAGDIVLTNSAPALSSYTLNAGATHTFDGWSTILTADVMTVYGVITHPPNNDTSGTAGDYASWTPDNRVYLVCDTLVVATNAQINVDAKGYGSRDENSGLWAYGPGAPTGQSCGGGFGGRGGDYRLAPTGGGSTYGSATFPVDPGSGGARSAALPGGWGGGAVRIEVSGQVTINGAITADGGPGLGTNYRGGGSGGSILIACDTLAGTNGTLRAAGGLVTAGTTGCGGGGGRVAIHIGNRAAQSALPMPDVTASSRAGWRSDVVFEAGYPGSVYWNVHPLTLSASPGGATDITGGWHTNLAEVAIQALPDSGCSFGQWSGAGVPEGAWTNNPLTVTMDRARVIQANFVSDTPAARAWTGESGDWFDSTNWDPAGIPGPSDAVSILTGSPLLGDPASIGSLTLSDATLTVSNWYAALSVAGDVTIQNNGILTLPAAFRATGRPEGMDVPMSNRVQVSCANFHLNTGGKVDADDKGYHGDHERSISDSLIVARYPAGGSGVGTAGSPVGGSSHGGRGAARSGDAAARAALPAGPTYGSLTQPTAPGTGGSTPSGTPGGGHGGGVIRISATGAIVVNGTITAEGGDGIAGSYGPGGTGGSIWMTAQTIAGNGLISAGGGDPHRWWVAAAGGAGGRIALHYDPTAQRAILPPTLRLRNKAGRSTGNNTGNWVHYRDEAEMGSVYLTDDALVRESLSPYIEGYLFMSGVSALAYDSLTLSNAWIGFEPGFTLTITNTLTVLPGTETTRLNRDDYEKVGVRFHLPGGELSVGGNVTVAPNGGLHLYAGPTNGIAPAYGGQFNVGGDILVESDGTLFTYANPTNGGAMRIRARNVTLPAGALIEAAGRGFVDNTGPGRGNYLNSDNVALGGGGYGGKGGRATAEQAMGDDYGDPLNATAPGSGGGGNAALRGGGVVWIEADGRLLVDGDIRADGQGGDVPGGTGAGGGIHLVSRRFDGAGTLSAAGGDNTRGTGRAAGGGGRILAARQSGSFLPYQASAPGGTSVAAGLYNGGDGTVTFIDLPRAGSLIIIR